MTDRQLASPAVAPYNAIAKNITAYIASSGNNPMKCALYINSTKAFVASTEERTINTGGSTTFQWKTFNFTTEVTITSGTTYLIACYSDYISGVVRLG